MTSDSGYPIESDKDKAEALALQYDSVYTVETSPSPTLPSRPNAMTHVTFNPDAIRRALERLDSQSAPGPDGIHPLLLRALSNLKHVPLTMLFQKCLDSYRLPRPWKYGLMKPMFKGGDSSTLSNYRPVTLTSTVGKIMEKLVVEELDKFLSGSPCNEQHGFTKRLSPVSNLLTARESWCKLIGDDVIFIDLTAFLLVAY